MTDDFEIVILQILEGQEDIAYTSIHSGKMYVGIELFPLKHPF